MDHRTALFTRVRAVDHAAKLRAAVDPRIRALRRRLASGHAHRSRAAPFGVCEVRIRAS